MSIRIPLLLAAPVLLAAFLPATARAQADTAASAPEVVVEDAASLAQARQRFIRGFSSATRARIAAAFAPDARAITNQRSVPANTFVDLAVEIDARNATWTQREQTVVSPTRVVEQGNYRFQSASRTEFRGDYTITWIHLDGVWLIQELRMHER
jgi:hypothetical protein